MRVSCTFFSSSTQTFFFSTTKQQNTAQNNQTTNQLNQTPNHQRLNPNAKISATAVVQKPPRGEIFNSLTRHHSRVLESARAAGRRPRRLRLKTPCPGTCGRDATRAPLCSTGLRSAQWNAARRLSSRSRCYGQEVHAQVKQYAAPSLVQCGTVG